MNKKLLITLGCSWTYGIGVYTDESLAEYKITKDIKKLHAMNIHTCPRYSWPTQLSKLLDYDLINLAIPGASHSGQVKALINGKYDTTYFSKWNEVHVVFMLTGNQRFSFYKDKNEIVEYNPGSLNGSWLEPSTKLFLEQYVQLITDSGVEQETIFYVNCLANYCRANNYNFNYLSSWNPMLETLLPNSLHEKLGWGKNSAKWRIQQEVPDNLDWGISFCGHPNKDGYALIARELAKVLT